MSIHDDAPDEQQARESQPAGTSTPDGRDLGDRTWSRARFDIVLAPAPPN